MLNWLIGDGYDGLRLCSVCGDRETMEDVCWVCRQQAMIDESDPLVEQQTDFFFLLGDVLDDSDGS